MAIGGWVEPWRFQDEARRRLCAEMTNTGLGPDEQREAFICRIEPAVSIYLEVVNGSDEDDDMIRHRLERVREAGQKMQAALQGLGDHSACLLKHCIAGYLLKQGIAGQDILHRFLPRTWLDDTIESVKRVTDGAAWMFARPQRRGPRTGGADTQLVALIAQAYADTFGKKPSSKPNGPFGRILAIVLDETGAPMLGETRLRRIINRLNVLATN